MRQVRGFFEFLWEFVIGDDWRIAVGVVAALVVTALVAHNTSVTSWWILPVVVALMLAVSVWGVARARR